MLILAQQIVMVVRAMFELGFWGAEVAAFRGLDEPRWCRAKVLREKTTGPPTVSDALPESAAS